MVLSTVRESGWSVPLAMAEEDMETTSESDVDEGPPVHPVPTMQGAFEESMVETMNENDEEEPLDRYSKADSVTRRKMLLEQDHYERTVAGRWKQKAGERFHPLWKLVAQISFGMHLLQQGLAKSDEEVLKILQTHVDEVDGFLERTTEDFDLAQGDINERIRYLKLPLEHGEVFDRMLDDKNFRSAIVEGNEKIEHIIDRTAAAMNDALKDVQKGLDATRELAKYMTRVDKMWENRTEEHDSVYLAMIGNTEGWTRAFLTLQSKGCHLRKALVQLGSIVAEMQKRAGAASRKNLLPSRSAPGRYYVPPRSPSPMTSSTPPRSPNKPLPEDPNPAARIASSQRYTRTSTNRSANSSPQLVQTAGSSSRSHTRMDNGVSPRIPNNARSPQTLNARSSQTLNARSSQTLNARSPQTLNAGWSPRPPDPSRIGRSPTPDKYSRTHDLAKSPRSPNLGLGISDRHPDRYVSSKSPDPQSVAKHSQTQRSVRSPEPARSLKSPEPQYRNVRSPQYPQEESSEVVGPPRTSAQTMQRMTNGNNSSEQSLSRRKSLTERTRSLLGKRPSVKKGFSSASNTVETVDKDPATSNESPAVPAGDVPEEPQLNNAANATLLRRLSSRRRQQAMSMSAYSESPVSQMRANDTPPPREASPQHMQNGRPVPPQSTYVPLTLLPSQPEFSPLHDPFPSSNIDETSDPHIPANATVVSSSATVAPSLKTNIVPDDSEGSVNVAHPLLREERHARFATRTKPGTSRNLSSGSLPLRHYHSHANFAQSNPDLTQRQHDQFKAPKRSSSLLYTPNDAAFNSRGLQKTERLSPTTEQASPTHDQTTPNASALNLMTRTSPLPPETELGIHPAHRVPELDSAPETATSPNHSSASSSTEQGATPPPISTGPSHPNSPPTRFAPDHSSRAQSPRESQSPQRNGNPPAAHFPDNSAESQGQSQNVDPKQTPFYLNPASSTLLKEFMESPPESRAHSPGPAASQPHGQFSAQRPPQSPDKPQMFNQGFRSEAASPPPPGPGGSNPAGYWSTQDLGAGNTKGANGVKQKKGLGLKKMFGASKSVKRPKEKSAKRRFWSKNLNAEPCDSLEHDNASSVDMEKSKDGEYYQGVGPDGVWISRQNFVRK